MWPCSCTHTTAGATAVAIGRCPHLNVSPRPVRWKLRRNGFKRVVPVLSVTAASTSWFPTPAEGGCRIWGQTQQGPLELPVYYRRFIVHDGKQNCSFLFWIATHWIFFKGRKEKKNKKNKSPPRLAEQSTAAGCALPCCDCFGCFCTRHSFTSKRASYKLLEWLSCTTVGGQSAASTVGATR